MFNGWFQCGNSNLRAYLVKDFFYFFPFTSNYENCMFLFYSLLAKVYEGNDERLGKDQRFVFTIFV